VDEERKRVVNLDHIFIDLAVSDPDPNKGEILALAVVRTDYKGKVLKAFSETISTSDEFDERRFKTVIGRMQELILAKTFEMSYIVVAYGGDDRRFLRSSWERIAHDEAEVFPRRAWLDVQQLAWPLIFNDMMSDRTLDSLCVQFGISRDASTVDTAMGDCEALVRIYWAMMTRYRGALKGEEMVRQAGGETLAKVRKVVGSLF
jgi:hypothetical protein